MAKSGKGSAHRHLNSQGKWSDKTDVASGSPHDHDNGTLFNEELAARVSNLEAALAGKAAETHAHEAYALTGHTHTPPPPAAVFGDLPGWKLDFSDDFTDRTVLRGHWLDGNLGMTAGAIRTADRRYLVGTWKDTNQKGQYDGAQVEIANGIMDILLETRAWGPNNVVQPVVCVFKPVGASADQNTAGYAGPIRLEFRLRADYMPGYKGVPLLWPTIDWRTIPGATSSDDAKWVYGEVDWPEGDFNKAISAYMHWPNVQKDATGKYIYPWQTVFPAPAGVNWQDWHNYAVEFVPNARCDFFLDGVRIGATTQNVPYGSPMRPNMQFETMLGSVYPDPAVKGHVQIDRIGVWKGA